MQPTNSTANAEPSPTSDFPPSSRPRTAIEAASTIIQAVRRGDATPYDAAQRVLAALGLPVNAPLPPSPPTGNGAEDEERAASGITSSLPPSSSASPFSAPSAVTDEMVSRFLCWRLPATFSPDGGVTFDRAGRDPNSHWWPTGTNILNAEEAREMLEHVLAKSAPASNLPGDDAIRT